MRFFNTAGPVKSNDHYILSPLQRFDLESIEFLIAQKKYFILHAPRQTGKTTSLNALADHLNKNGMFACVYINVEPAQAARENVEQAMRAILSRLASQIKWLFNDSFFQENWEEVLNSSGPFAAFVEMISKWCEHLEKPVVLLIDEIDSLVGDTLISILRQIREGYNNRPERFPSSIILCGVRDIRDYRIHSGKEKSIITGGSAFNIKAKSLRLGDFTKNETDELINQHEIETGQKFTTNAKESVWYYTNGQPWLVNALCYETCFEMKQGRDRSKNITKEMMDQAKENLILRRETHLDQLTDKLKEARVKNIIEPLLKGETDISNLPDDDILYCKDLGLIKQTEGLVISNPIYSEIIPRQLTYSTQQTITHETKWYIDKDGKISMEKLMANFQEFFQENSEHWVERFQYKEAGPQLLLQAFLQRVINSGGRIEREYGLGRKRTDILIIWPYNNNIKVQKEVLELKILRKNLDKTISEGMEQISQYMDRCGVDHGHLVIFDRSENKGWKEKIFYRERAYKKNKILIWGM